MKTKHPLILILVLVMGLGAIYALPRQGKLQDSAVIMKLPSILGVWTGTPREAGTREKAALDKGTEFEKMVYTSPGNPFIDVSIVLSGDDMNNSIHRPERCLPAQGHQILHSDTVVLKGEDERDEFVVSRLHTIASMQVSEDEEKFKDVEFLHYYWFVGKDRETHSHLERTLQDMKDRLVHGYNQRWAYIQLSCVIPGTGNPFNHDTKERVNAVVKDFIVQLRPRIVQR